MDLVEARTKFDELVNEKLWHYEPGDLSVRLDADFSLDELRAIVAVLEADSSGGE